MHQKTIAEGRLSGPKYAFERKRQREITFRVMKRARELVFQVGLVLLAIILGKALDSPFGYVTAGVLSIAFVVQWVLQREDDSELKQATLLGGATPEGIQEIGEPEPSLLFVFGAPLGDNDSSTWIMMLKHYGPGSAHNCSVDFYDDDRKNIKHQWLVAHPDSPFPPPGLAGESRKRVHFAESGPEESAGAFSWNPLDPNRQHYTVSISCRDGVFEEKWEVTRVNGILRSSITIEHGPQWIEKNPNLEPVIFRCSDPEFVRTPLATEVPKLPKKAVHPGWKPNHRMEVPVAIIDPNGNTQILVGTKLPDGRSSCGCWNILTEHFGDHAH
jgi:hypothetical protein